MSDELDEVVINALRNKLGDLKSQLAQVTQERDEARAEVGALRGALEALDEHIGYQDTIGEDVCAHYLGEEANPALRLAFDALHTPSPAYDEWKMERPVLAGLSACYDHIKDCGDCQDGEYCDEYIALDKALADALNAWKEARP